MNTTSVDVAVGNPTSKVFMRKHIVDQDIFVIKIFRAIFSCRYHSADLQCILVAVIICCQITFVHFLRTTTKTLPPYGSLLCPRLPLPLRCTIRLSIE